MRRISLLLVVVLVACTGGPTPTRATTSEGPNVLFFATPLGVTVFDVRTQQAMVSVPGGILAPDRSAVFATSGHNARTDVQTFDPVSGKARDIATLDGARGLRVADHDGSTVVLGPPRHETGADYPSGRTSTTLTIVKVRDGSSRSIDVAGNVEPEAFSADDTNLFVLQYLPAEAPVGYQVRRVDLSTGELHNVRTDDSDLDKPMAGRARTQVLSPDGTRLYTLYVVAGDATGGPGYAFVHVLDLTAKHAFCIDLPSPFGTAGSAAYAVALSRDGGQLYAVDPQLGVLSQLDTTSLHVTRTVSIPATQPPSAFAAVARDGQVLVGAGRDLWSLAPDTLTETTRATLDGSAAAVITTAFDDNAYLAVNSTIEVFDSRDVAAGPQKITRVPGAPGLIAADPVPSVDNRGRTECAC